VSEATEEPKRIELAERMRQIIEELERIRSMLSKIDLNSLKPSLEALERIKNSWRSIYDCLMGRCVFEVTEGGARSRYIVRVRAPFPITMEVDSGDINQVSELLRKQVAENFNVFLMETANTLNDALTYSVVEELNKVISTNEHLRHRLDDVEEEVRKLYREMEKAIRELID